jgi:hypothetical protein
METLVQVHDKYLRCFRVAGYAGQAEVDMPPEIPQNYREGLRDHYKIWSMLLRFRQKDRRDVHGIVSAIQALYNSTRNGVDVSTKLTTRIRLHAIVPFPATVVLADLKQLSLNMFVVLRLMQATLPSDENMTIAKVRVQLEKVGTIQQIGRAFFKDVLRNLAIKRLTNIRGGFLRGVRELKRDWTINVITLLIR